MKTYHRRMPSPHFSTRFVAVTGTRFLDFRVASWPRRLLIQSMQASLRVACLALKSFCCEPAGAAPPGASEEAGEALGLAVTTVILLCSTAVNGFWEASEPLCEEGSAGLV